MSERGRPGKYETHVQPRLEEIKEWVRQGVAVVDIAKALGVNKSTLCVYANKYQDLKDALHHVPRPGVQQVRDALLRKACGYRYTETKKIVRINEKTGEKELVRMEVTEKEVPPDSSAAAMYLRNYDDAYVDSDGFTRKIKTEELEIKKQTAEAQNW